MLGDALSLGIKVFVICVFHKMPKECRLNRNSAPLCDTTCLQSIGQCFGIRHTRLQRLHHIAQPRNLGRLFAQLAFVRGVGGGQGGVRLLQGVNLWRAPEDGRDV